MTGQLDVLNASGSALAHLAMPITGRGYLAPIDADTIGVGATYEYEPWPDAESTLANLAHVQRLLGESWHPDDSATQRRKAVRCVSSDRNPVIGPLFDLEGAENVGRLVSVGHGSMGTVTSHLAASLITATLTGQFEPLEASLLAQVSSNRFRRRQVRRGYRFGAEP